MSEALDRLARAVAGDGLCDLSDLPEPERLLGGPTVVEAVRRAADEDRTGLTIQAARIDGDLRLDWLRLSRDLALYDCAVDGTIDVANAHLGSLQICDTAARWIDLSHARISGRARFARARARVLARHARIDGGMDVRALGPPVAPHGSAPRSAVDLYSAVVGGDLEITESPDIDADLDLSEAQVAGATTLSGLEVTDGRVLLVGARLRRVRVAACRIDGGVDASAAELTGLRITDTKAGQGALHALQLTEIRATRSIAMSSCVLRAPIDLQHARVGGQVSFVETTVFGAAGRAAILATGLHADNGLIARATTLHGELRCDRASLPAGFALDDCTVGNPDGDAVELSPTRTGASLHILDSRLQGRLVAQSAQVDGQLSLRGTTVTVTSGEAVVLDGLAVQGSLLASAGFRCTGGFQMRGAAVGFGHASGASSTTLALELNEAQLEGPVELSRTRLAGAATFDRARCGGFLRLSGCVFEATVSFVDAEINGTLDLRDAVLDGPTELRVATPGSEMRLDGVRVSRPALLDLHARAIRLQGAVLEAETTIEATGDITARGLRVRAASRLAGSSSADAAVRLLELQDATLDAPLSIAADVDASACRFMGAQGLDRLALATSEILGLRDGRRALVEENDATATTAAGPQQIAHGDVARLYRALRKGLEDAKDAPGAADFYFGEMEMRRTGATRLSERTLITLYWLVSGYGLRAGRAALSLLLVLTLATAGLMLGGYADAGSSAVRIEQSVDLATGRPTGPQTATSSQARTPDPCLDDAVVQTLNAAVGLPVAVTERPLNQLGSVIRVLVRILAPVLLALLVLALRARVQR